MKKSSIRQQNQSTLPTDELTTQLEELQVEMKRKTNLVAELEKEAKAQGQKELAEKEKEKAKKAKAQSKSPKPKQETGTATGTRKNTLKRARPAKLNNEV